MGIRDEQKEKRRDEILNAGLDLFIRKGYAATKISDIAKQAGMSVGLMFHYFESKEKLYEALIEIGISGPMEIMPEEDASPLAYFERTAEKLFRHLKSAAFPAKMFVLMNQAYFNEAAPQSVKDKLSGIDVYTPTAELIKKGQRDGSIRDGNPYALAAAFWSAINGIAALLAQNPDAPCPESGWIIDIIRRK